MEKKFRRMKNNKINMSFGKIGKFNRKFDLESETIWEKRNVNK